MIVNLYAVHDKLAGTYANPFTQNERIAERTFRWMQQDAEAKDCEDKEICLLGTYDTESGEVIGQTPVSVFNLEKEANK